MPNHICNTVKFIGTHEDIQNLLITIKSSENGIVDFNNVIPMPDIVSRDDMPLTEISDPNKWYYWSVTNWGTKWNAYDSYYPATPETQIRFYTAWNGPEPVLLKLSELYPNVILNTFQEDEGGIYVSQIVYKNGLVLFQSEPNLFNVFDEEGSNSPSSTRDRNEFTRICLESNSDYMLRCPIAPVEYGRQWRYVKLDD